MLNREVMKHNTCPHCGAHITFRQRFLAKKCGTCHQEAVSEWSVPLLFLWFLLLCADRAQRWLLPEPLLDGWRELACLLGALAVMLWWMPLRAQKTDARLAWAHWLVFAVMTLVVVMVLSRLSAEAGR
jgi:predicted nucleic acid-binding Zn ribbon protein